MKLVNYSVIFLLLLAGTASAEEFTIVGQDFAPLNSLEKNEVVGAMADLLRSACAKLGAKCKFEILPFQRALKMVSEGSADIILSVAKIPDREPVMTFSIPLLRSRYGFFGVKGRTSDLRDFADLKGRTVGVYAPTASAESLKRLQKQHGGFDIEVESALDLSMRKLLAGRYGSGGLVYVNELVGRAWARQNGKSDIFVALGGETVVYYAAYSKKSIRPDTQAKFDRIINAMAKSGEIERIYSSYGIENTPVRN